LIAAATVEKSLIRAALTVTAFHPVLPVGFAARISAFRSIANLSSLWEAPVGQDVRHAVPFSRKIDHARDFERQALGEVLDEMVQHLPELNIKEIRNGRLSAEPLEKGEPERLDVLFKIHDKKNGTDQICIAMQVIEGVYEYAGTINANGSQIEVTEDITNGFFDLVLAYDGLAYRRQ
jgi:hypothetical protein